MLESLILYLKGMRIVMFQLSGIHYRGLGFKFQSRASFVQVIAWGLAGLGLV